MVECIAPEYREIEKGLASFVEKHKLDSVTVGSLIRGSVEILEPELPAASVAVIDAKNWASSTSIKPRNIKVNLKFALNSIFAFKEWRGGEDDGVWLVLTILKIILFFLDEIKIELGENEAIVLFCVYRLESASLNDIMEYANSIKEIGKSDIQTEDVNEALETLESISSVKMENGKYQLCESVLIKK